MPVHRTLGLATGLLGAVLGSQLPEFAQQYRQRLGGALDELRPVVERFDTEARNEGLDRPAALRRLSDNADALARRRGEAVADSARRMARLEDQQRRMGEAGPFGRVATLLADPDPTLWGGTMRTFEPAMPVTAEGLVAAVLGFLLGRGMVRWPAAGLGRLRRRGSRVA
ncbi:DUF2937 family protein [uncultured Alsobacter sp.]|uniref:DUF2937 family protein n=1 Tax=uncultured Alsobacter sp. TaxID=1748258 RepID=UPI0025E304C7|nr:DUF2937 family protein [uncultured Alsobacter sp.]